MQWIQPSSSGHQLWPRSGQWFLHLSVYNVLVGINTFIVCILLLSHHALNWTNVLIRILYSTWPLYSQYKKIVFLTGLHKFLMNRYNSFSIFYAIMIWKYLVYLGWQSNPSVYFMVLSFTAMYIEFYLILWTLGTRHISSDTSEKSFLTIIVNSTYKIITSIDS